MAGELAQLLEEYLPAYRREHKLSKDQWRACKAILGCRTGQLGWMAVRCDRCGVQSEFPCSCRDRHCPQCQASASLAWRTRYQNRLAQVPSYHVVFTVAAE